MNMKPEIEIISPNSFTVEEHWYPKALNATIHPMVNFFLHLTNERIIARYCHLHPKVNQKRLRELLGYECKYFHWSGADLINATTSDGIKKMLIIENNSCPSGQKSMPLLDDNVEAGSYRLLIDRTCKLLIENHRKKNKLKGKIAVIYDKNYMEASGYAAILADVFGEDVFLIQCFDKLNNHFLVEDGYLKFNLGDKRYSIDAAFRYVTQRPWNRIPLHSNTLIINPIIACLAGGRNKMLAAKAYDAFNEELEHTGLKINIPDTIRDVKKEDIPKWVDKFGGQAVVKIPYSNAGQGVFTIVNKKELSDFMALEIDYTQFIVQSLIGNYTWSSLSEKGRYFHVGTIPNSKNETYVADIRLMVSSTKQGIKPLCMYSRKALIPLADELTQGQDSWGMLGTNLSIKVGENKWDSDTNRLMIMDRRDYNKLGLGLDDLIEAYIQTVLSTIAIDKMCKSLFNSKGNFRLAYFKKLNDDDTLLNEIMI